MRLPIFSKQHKHCAWPCIKRCTYSDAQHKSLSPLTMIPSGEKKKVCTMCFIDTNGEAIMLEEEDIKMFHQEFM